MRSQAIEYFAPPLGGPTDAQVAEAKRVLDERKAALRAQQKGTLLKCTTQAATGRGCGELSPVGDLTYTQHFYYVNPHGCTGGDYWAPKEGSWTCPKCGHRNRLYASPEVTAMRDAFKTKVEAHDA